MARVVVVTYQCPRCKADLARRFGLIGSRRIPCPSCGAMVNIDAQVIGQNWAFNFGWVGGVGISLFLAVMVVANQDFAASVGGKTFPTGTQQQRVTLAAMMVIPGILLGLVAAGVGMGLGALVGSMASSETEAAPAPPPGFPGSRLPTSLPAVPPQAKGRGCLIRMIFICFWPVAFFMAAVVVMTFVSGAASAETEELRKQLSKESAEKHTGWMMLGTFITFLLGCFGVLPWTGKGRKKPPPPPDMPSARIDPNVFRS